jgi:hypothetical protein
MSVCPDDETGSFVPEDAVLDDDREARRGPRRPRAKIGRCCEISCRDGGRGRVLDHIRFVLPSTSRSRRQRGEDLPQAVDEVKMAFSGVESRLTVRND